MAKARKAMPEFWIVRMARGHAKLWIAIALGLVIYAVLPGEWRAVSRTLVAWDVGVAAYLILAAAMMAKSPAAEIRKHSADQDEGALALMVLSITAAMISLAAIFLQLASSGDDKPDLWSHVLAIVTVVLSWSFIHTIFALHYAHDFYGEGQRANGLKFPDDQKPDYWDFIYFSFVIGMTFQVSDVQVTNKWIRRSVIAHGVLSFFFTTTVVALTVNMAANAI
jgi:uncharacterized membrane protein